MTDPGAVDASPTDSPLLGYARLDLIHPAKSIRALGKTSLIFAILSMAASGYVGWLEVLQVWRLHQRIEVVFPILQNQQAQANSQLSRMNMIESASLKKMRAERLGPHLRPWSDNEIRRLVRVLCDGRKPELTAAQWTTLVNELQQPGQRVADPDLPIKERMLLRPRSLHQLIEAQLDREGTLSLKIEESTEWGGYRTRPETIHIAADGTTLPESDPWDWKPIAIPSIRPLLAAEQAARSERLRFAAATLAMGVNLLLSCLWIVAARAALQNHSNCLRLHRRYAWNQLGALLMVGSCVAWFSPVNDFRTTHLHVAELGVLTAAAALYPLYLSIRVRRLAAAYHSPLRDMGVTD